MELFTDIFAFFADKNEFFTDKLAFLLISRDLGKNQQCLEK